jgi:hypothetical protein
MLGGIVGAVSGLATSYIDSKTAKQKADAELQLKRASGEIDWEIEALKASKDSWKDELWTVVFVVILAANFVPSLQPFMQAGFANLEATPLWVQMGMGASISASFGIKMFRGFKQ